MDYWNNLKKKLNFPFNLIQNEIVQALCTQIYNIETLNF